MSIHRGPLRVMKFALAIIESARLLLWTGIYGARYLASTSRRRGMDQRASARLLRNYRLRMALLYVKAGQILGTQTGVMAQDQPRSSGRSLGTYSDAQPGFEETLRNNLPLPVDQLFKEFDGNRSLLDPLLKFTGAC